MTTMPEGQPPRPSRPVTGRIPAPIKPGSSPSIRPATGTRRMPTAPSEPEVVVSSDSDQSTVRRRVGGSLKPRGLSLRWKIVVGMTGITVVTAIIWGLCVFWLAWKWSP